MVAKKTGISREMIIHPGETIADILSERGISQLELASSTGVSPAYVSKVVSGKKDISAKFAFALEYALDVPKSFWLNLQANYDAELLEYNEPYTITEDERIARASLTDVVKYLRNQGKLPQHEETDESILSLRKALRVSNITNVCHNVLIEEYKPEKNTRHNLYVLGAWLRLCQIKSEEHRLDASFSHENIDSLVNEITNIMKSGKPETNDTLHTSFLKYGIDYSILKPFKSAPVQGFISSKADGTYQMVVSESDSSSKSFWTNVFHELGHIVNGDIRKNTSFIDNGCNPDIDRKADEFAKSIIG